VLPVARAFYNSNKSGQPDPLMKGTLDLIFARVPTPPGKDTNEFEVFDGHRLVPIWEYLLFHPRPDLIQLNRRMRWLSVGPWGNRSGDILLLTKSGLNRPIQDRYYFSGPYHSWHGSASPQDSYVPLIVARQNYSSAKIKKMVDKAAGSEPSHLSVVPIVLRLLVSETADRTRSAGNRSGSSAVTGSFGGSVSDYAGSGPVSDARCEISMKLPSGSRMNEIRATAPSETGAEPSHTPIDMKRRCSASTSRTCTVR